MNITKQTYRHREQTSGYQWREGRGRGKLGVGVQEIQITMYKISKLPGYIVQTGNIANALQ